MSVPEPFFKHHVETHTAKEAFEYVLADVGCNVPVLDDHGKCVIEETRAGTMTCFSAPLCAPYSTGRTGPAPGRVGWSRSRTRLRTSMLGSGDFFLDLETRTDET